MRKWVSPDARALFFAFPLPFYSAVRVVPYPGVIKSNTVSAPSIECRAASQGEVGQPAPPVIWLTLSAMLASLGASVRARHTALIAPC